jgi:hypothetical protein
MQKEFTFQRGFQITSEDKLLALKFANPTFDKENPEIVSVILKIELTTNKNFFKYDENTHAFPDEKEVLLQEGLKFKILNK